MEYISSDTNVWLDFMTINRLEYPFRLSYTYLMNIDAIDDELLSPPGLNKELMELGLQETEMSFEEFVLAQEYMNRYSKPSKYDCIALAIAKNRNITLLTGDGALRKAALSEKVKVMGTLGVLDLLHTNVLINNEEYLYCLKELSKNNGAKVRLPRHELELRIKSIEDLMVEI